MTAHFCCTSIGFLHIARPSPNLCSCREDDDIILISLQLVFALIARTYSCCELFFGFEIMIHEQIFNATVLRLESMTCNMTHRATFKQHLVVKLCCKFSKEIQKPATLLPEFCMLRLKSSRVTNRCCNIYYYYSALKIPICCPVWIKFVCSLVLEVGRERTLGTRFRQILEVSSENLSAVQPF